MTYEDLIYQNNNVKHLALKNKAIKKVRTRTVDKDKVLYYILPDKINLHSDTLGAFNFGLLQNKFYITNVSLLKDVFSPHIEESNDITVDVLYKLCAEQIKLGNGKKKVFISSDDEGNDYHQLFYGFCYKDEEVKMIKSSCCNDEIKVGSTILLG